MTFINTKQSQSQSQQQPIPRDARLIGLILASMNITNIQPLVILQLLEFANRYVYDVLCDSLIYSDHAHSKQGSSSSVSLQDISLAIQSRINHSFTKPPEKHLILSLASLINSVPLPPISDRHGIKLPPSNLCLTNVNYTILPNLPPPQDSTFSSSSLPVNTTEAEADTTVVQNTSQQQQPTTITTDNTDSDTVMDSIVVDALQEQTRGTKRSLDEDQDYD